MKKKHKICFITPGHFVTNPRLIKEAQSLNPTHYEIHIVSTQYIKNLIPLEAEFRNSHPEWEFHIFDWSSWIKKKIISIKKKTFKALAYIFPSNYSFLEKYLNSAFNKQLNMAVNIRASHYIAHNLAALPIAAIASKKNTVTYSFDAEDFHRGQYDLDSIDSKHCILIEDKYFKTCKFITTASPLINKMYEKLYPYLKFHCIKNVFPKEEFANHVKKNTSRPLKLIWFSQTVGQNRGLENIFKALNQITEYDIHFFLYGEATLEVQIYLNNLLSNKKHKIAYLGTVSPKILNLSLSEYDIGIAAEPRKDINNNIALSNKILSYVQAGLCIIASDTSAQTEFMKNKEIGLLYYNNDVNEIVKIINQLHINRDLLWKFRENSINLSETLNWENEKEKFLSLLKYE